MRWKDVFIWKRGYAMFESLVDNGEITKITHGAWTDVYYHSGRWYLCRYEDDNRITDDTPFCYGFTLEGVENEKLTSELTHISLIVFDDFIESSVYLKNEFLIFISVLAHVMRHTCKRNHIVIYMLGNPKNKNCPYFNEMGLYHVTDMKPGSLDLYLYSANGGSNIAVEFCGDGEPTIIQYHKPYRRCK